MVLKYIIRKDIYNIPVLLKLDEENDNQLEKLHEVFIEVLGYDVNDEVLKTIALKRLLECYNSKEIITILKYFQQLKNGDNT